MNSKNRIAVPAALVAVAGLSASAMAQLVFTPIALSGRSDQYGPGMGAGVNFSSVFSGASIINNSGQVMFRANQAGTGTPEGYWVYSGGANSNVAIAGGARPGGGSYNTGSSGIFGQGIINDLGEWAVRNGSQTGIFMGTGPSGNRIAFAGDTAPGTGGALWSSSAVATGTPYYNHVGGIAFIGNFAASTTSTPPVVTTGATTNASALFVSNSAGATNMVLRQNDASSLLDAGQTAGESRVGSFQTGSMAYNSNGRYITSVNLQGANIITATGTAGQNNGAILTNRNGSMEVVARAGALAPTTTGALGTEYFRGTASTGITSGAIGFNDNGRVAFVSGLRDGGTTQTGSSVLFTDTIGGVLRQVGRNATPIPTIYRPDGSVNTAISGNWASFTNPVINANDVVAMTASGNNVASIVLTLDTTGRWTSIATSATVAIPGGAFDGTDINFSSFSNVQINRWGQMAFTANLSGNGVAGGPGGNNSSVWVYDPTLGLQMVARTSDPFTVMNGDVRTVQGYNITGANGGQDGRQISLNDNGTFTFALGFTDGSSGVFTTSVPAPGAAAALGLAGIASLRRRRR
ncbi:MAG: hypothetical protein QM783_01445 [Phycisphaerales bacterium]